MIRRLIILLLIVGCVYAQNDKLILKNGESYNVKYGKILEDGTIRVQIHKDGSILATSFNRDEIYELILEDDTIIIKSEPNYVRNNIDAGNHLIKSANHLKTFKSEYYTGATISALGAISTLYGYYNADEDYINYGTIGSLIGSIFIFF